LPFSTDVTATLPGTGTVPLLTSGAVTMGKPWRKVMP
jgi:hypothetical protein